MYKTCITEQELSARIYVDESCEVLPIASAEWVNLFHSTLLASGSNVLDMYQAFRDAVSGFLSADQVFRVKSDTFLEPYRVRDVITLTRLRWELSRVPVPFRLRITYPKSSTDSTRSSKVILAECEGQRYVVGSPDCPKEVFSVIYDADFDRMVQRERVFALYPPALAQRLGFSMKPTWSEDNSLVDWMLACVESERYRVSPRIHRHEPTPQAPLCWSFYRLAVDGILPKTVRQPLDATASEAAPKAAAGDEGSEAELDVSKAAAAETETAPAERPEAAAAASLGTQNKSDKAAAGATDITASDAVSKVAAGEGLSEIPSDVPKAAAAETETAPADEAKAAADVSLLAASDRDFAIHILKEKFTPAPNHRVGRGRVYHIYTTCVSENAPGRAPLSAGKFYKLVREVYPKVLQKTPRINGKPTRSFIGIKHTD